MKLIDYLPQILKDIREFKYLSATGDVQLNTARLLIDSLADELFISTADGVGLERLEGILDIINDTEDLELRRFRIITKINGGERSVIKKIRLIAGDDFICEYDKSKFKLTVKLPLRNKEYLDAVKEMLDKDLPLNVIIDATLKYNTYGQIKNKQLTYGKLKGRTFKEIKEVELDELQ